MRREQLMFLGLTLLQERHLRRDRRRSRRRRRSYGRRPRQVGSTIPIAIMRNAVNDGTKK